MDIIFKENDLILFQGDSITDCERNRADSNSLGNGYVALTSVWLSALYPQYNLKFLNRGISGDRTRDLVFRWDFDCIALKPNWISILVGINNTMDTTTERFEEEYRILLDRTAKELDARIILCEPFLVSTDSNPWRDDLDPKICVVRKLAIEYDALLIPLDKIFITSCTKKPPEYWAPDGVHPSPVGHALIAQSWIKCVQA
ncbi:MAG: GDSL family lipase [Candidatus Scalindua sp. AMX11]|nr:MAG: GDSL family lipase [Candidatus Scalindua sp.]NOG82779.1 SGNH/GDSL hydrolase family protein [Planctomycetota bacterium]RZV95345.1 MAG: GDSL family lipase [Candidatus Scalindua sp. SCAELEC01]TDE66172.1 MAG: GDSL family lipase [Candidatus Scalindua sp. AMX11]GJQ57790.1 MAG: lipase [Candidatus Scalindua sp.]